MSNCGPPTNRSSSVRSGSHAGSAGIDISTIVRGVRLDAEHRLQQREAGARRPGLRHVGAEILHRESRAVARHAGIQLRQLVQQEVAGRPADVARDPRRLGGEAIAAKPSAIRPLSCGQTEPF